MRDGEECEAVSRTVRRPTPRAFQRGNAQLHCHAISLIAPTAAAHDRPPRTESCDTMSVQQRSPFPPRYICRRRACFASGRTADCEWQMPRHASCANSSRPAIGAPGRAARRVSSVLRSAWLVVREGGRQRPSDPDHESNTGVDLDRGSPSWRPPQAAHELCQRRSTPCDLQQPLHAPDLLCRNGDAHTTGQIMSGRRRPSCGVEWSAAPARSLTPPFAKHATHDLIDDGREAEAGVDV